MQIEIDIEFNQLVAIVKNLPTKKLQHLKNVINGEVLESKTNELEKLLLNGPTASKKQLEKIERNRQFLNEWKRK